MNDFPFQSNPRIYSQLQEKSKEIGFAMPSDRYIGSLLKTLVASKPAGNFLELGTGIGLSLSWMIDGMDQGSTLVTVDNDLQLIEIAMANFGHDPRVRIVCADGGDWIKNYAGGRFDLIFADAWPGKYGQLDETLKLLKEGGLYVVDDMDAQPNWPDGHQAKADALIADLEGRENLTLTKMNWSTGVIIAVKGVKPR